MQIVFDAQLFTERLSSDKLFQQSFSSMSADIVRHVDSVLEVILLSSGLWYLPGFALTKQDYDCRPMLETMVHVYMYHDFIILFYYTAR